MQLTHAPLEARKRKAYRRRSAGFLSETGRLKGGKWRCSIVRDCEEKREILVIVLIAYIRRDIIQLVELQTYGLNKKIGQKMQKTNQNGRCVPNFRGRYAK